MEVVDVPFISPSGQAQAELTPGTSPGTAQQTQQPGPAPDISPSGPSGAGPTFSENSMITVRGWVVRESDKAILFVAANHMEAPIWLPRSQITITDREWDHLVAMPTWLAQNNGIRVLPPAPRGRGHQLHRGVHDRHGAF